MASVDESIGTLQRVLADGGYANFKTFGRLENNVELYVAVADSEYNARQYDFRPPKPKTPKHITDARLVAMREKLSSENGRHICRERARTVEPVFGTINGGLHFRQFLRRGLSKVENEGRLVCLAQNAKRIWNLANG